MSMTKQEIWKKGREYRKENNVRKEVKLHKTYDKHVIDWIDQVLKEGKYTSFNSYVLDLIRKDMAIEHYGLKRSFVIEIAKARKKEVEERQKKENK